MQPDELAAALDRLETGHIPIPPDDAIFVGDGDYLSIAAEFLGYFVHHGELSPAARVLDVGCGIGRMAAGLACYLDPVEGSYFGFDPVSDGIEWCKTAYGAHPHFHFEWIDVYNELYRPQGKVLATNFQFPLDDRSVDFAILTSVFTHLYIEEITAYLRELARLTKPEGRIFATAYLFDGDAPQRMPSIPHLDFTLADVRHPYQWHVAGYPQLAAVAFSEQSLAERFLTETGRTAQILKGRWRGGAGPWFQDLVLA